MQVLIDLNSDLESIFILGLTWQTTFSVEERAGGSETLVVGRWSVLPKIVNERTTDYMVSYRINTVKRFIVGINTAESSVILGKLFEICRASLF